MADFATTIANLRKRLLDAKNLNIGSDSPQDFTLGVIIQIMNECERRRQECLRAQQDHLQQAKGAEYQAAAFSMVHSITESVYNGFIQAEERAIEERKAQDTEKSPNTEDAQSPSNGQKKRSRKGTTAAGA